MSEVLKHQESVTPKVEKSQTVTAEQVKSKASKVA